jgi:hypothetical protein
MASIISAGTTSSTALNMSGDTSGVLQLASNNGTVAVTVLTNQNVGIGATTPGFKLQVQNASSSARNGILILNSDGAGAPTGVIFQGYDWVRSAIWHDRSSGFPLQFAVNPNTTDLTVNGCAVVASFTDAGAFLVGGTTQNTANKPVYSSTTAKSWVKYNLNTQTVNASYNVSSVTYNGSGTFTVNFTNALTDANYVNVTGMKLITDANTNVQTTTQSTSSYQVVVSNPGITNYNQLIYVATFGN